MDLRFLLSRVVVVSALGYFVDIYDLLLFGILRTPSLTAIGVPAADQFATGLFILNWQMGGLLLGGILWGVLGDKRGRVKVLFASIFLYSLATFANAFVADVPTYAALRFFAGLGLAGELGAAVTLVAESLPAATRGYATAFVAGVGILGAVAAALVGLTLDWRLAYIVGGVLGLGLLVLRFTLRDSGLYRSLAATKTRRGDLLMLFDSRDRFARYVHSLLVGVPLWFVVGILITFSNDFAPLVGVRGTIVPGWAILWCYVGLTVGDFASGALSGLVRSRRKIIIGFLALTSGLMYAYVFSWNLPVPAFYGLCFALGIGAGYWAVFITNAAEQFGTNLRATVSTTAPNFVRGSVIPIALLVQFLADKVGLLLSAMIVGQATVLVALYAVWRLRETYGRDLDFVEAAATRKNSRYRSGPRRCLRDHDLKGISASRPNRLSTPLRLNGARKGGSGWLPQEPS